jgi:hypothetical protein
LDSLPGPIGRQDVGKGEGGILDELFGGGVRLGGWPKGRYDEP